MEQVIEAKTPQELRTELVKWARKNAASRVNNSKTNRTTATGRRLVIEASVYNDVADFLEGLKLE